MTKQIFLLLFTFLFSINLFAQSHDIHRDISDMKLQIQEIKLLDARDEREKKLEKLEKKIDDLDSKFNQNNIDKKDIEGKIGTQDKFITEIGSNTNRISLIISFFGVLITIIVIYFVVKFEKMAEVLAEKELKKWIKNEAMEEFEPKIKEIKDLIKKAESEVSLFKEKAESTINRIEKKLLENKELTNEEENEIKSDIKDIENKQEKDYTFADWRKKTLLYLIDNNYEEALKSVENMFIIYNDDLKISEALFFKAIILNKLNKNVEAIEVYDEVIRRFKDSKENGLVRKVSSALYNKGVTLGKMDGKSEEAIEVYDEVIRRFKDSKENDILVQVASALYNKGVTLGQIGGKSEEAIEVYNEVIRRFKDSKENGILKQVASALYNKGVILGKSEEAIEVYNEVIRRFKDSKENGILEQVARALHNKGGILGQMGGKSEEAIEVYDEVIRRFKNSKENSILEKVASALVNKIEINLILGNINSKEDLDLYFNLVEENKEKISLLEMLQIFEKAKDSNQDDEIKDWQIKFKDVKLENWSFNELKIWAETFKSEEKERLLRYINIFENHNKIIKEK